MKLQLKCCTQTKEEEDNEYDYMFDRTDNWDYFIMVGSLSIRLSYLDSFATNYSYF